MAHPVFHYLLHILAFSQNIVEQQKSLSRLSEGHQFCQIYEKFFSRSAHIFQHLFSVYILIASGQHLV